MQLYPQSHGDILYYKDGKEVDLKKLSYEEMRVLRKDLQLIFQDPYSSLNPRMTVGQIIGEGLTSHGIYKRGRPRHEGIHLPDYGRVRPGPLYV